MSSKTRSFLSVFLVLALVLTLVPAASAENGGFYLAAFADSGAVIEPEWIPATAGQTIRQTLLHSTHRFEGLEQGYILAVDGVGGNFYLSYDGGAYDLDAPADTVTGLLVTTTEFTWTQELQELLLLLGRFRREETGVQNYGPARDAYAAALQALKTGVDPVSAAAALEAAWAEFDALMAGQKVTLNFTITQGEGTLPSALLTLTGPYGDIHTNLGSAIDLIPGTYDYEISDGTCNYVYGSVELTGDMTLPVTLPSGAWFREVRLMTPTDKTEGYDRAILGTNAARFCIPDTAGSSSVFLNAVRGEVPDTATTRVWTDYVGLNGTDYSVVTRSWNTTSAVLTSLLARGMTGRSFRLEARYPHPDGYRMVQYYDIEILRLPTLENLSVSGDGIRLPLDFQSDTLSYAVVTASETLDITAGAFGEDGYAIAVNGEPVQTFPVTVPAADFSVTVSHASGTDRTYRVNVERRSPVTVTVTGSGVQIFNEAGAEIPGRGTAYTLIPGETYTCISTRDTWYHTRTDFTASAGLHIQAAEPRCTPWLTALGAAQKSTAGSLEKCPYELSPAFTPGTHVYDVSVGDVNTTFALFASVQDTAIKAKAQYVRLSTGAAENRTVTTNKTTGTLLPGLAEMTGASNTAILTLTLTEGSVTYYQEYELHTRRILSAYDCALSTAEGELTVTPAFDRDILIYETDVPQGADSLTLSLSGVLYENDPGYRASVRIGSFETACSIEANGVTLTVPLDVNHSEELLELTVSHGDPGSVSRTYTFTIHKLPPVRVGFVTEPETAVVGLVHAATGKRIWAAEDGRFILLQNHTYEASVTCPGYLPQNLTFQALSDETLTVTLEKAPVNDTLPTDLDAFWPDFRGNPRNNAVVDVPLPITQTDAVLNWASALGDGYSSGAVGCPILVGGAIYTYAGTTIYKVDPVDGHVIASGAMAGNSSFAINAPTYAEGMIFVGLSNGRVQAFNAETLESLWIYSDPLRGQPNCCITYEDGFLYTGFWNGETADANFVCLTVTDEDPAQTLESKTAVWTYTHRGGYYWSGACIRQGKLILGTDDGETGYLTGFAELLSLDMRTGRLLDSVRMAEPGDIRCAISYDETTDAYYFTSKGGCFYRIRVGEDGRFLRDTLQTIRLSNGADDPTAPPMSTSTPVVYGGRAYIGVCGTAQFGAYSGHNITVVDLPSWSIAYRVETQGYCQTSGLLTRAYEADTGKVYVYFFDNYTPGKLRILEDSPGQTAPTMLTRETYRESGREITRDMAYALFTPYGVQAQYAICSPICDETGTMFFKNDSGFLMALGPTIRELRITAEPRLTYSAGETFDPAGLRVEAVYSNGLTRDVTDYLTFSTEPLTADDQEFMLRFDHVMYQNREDQPGQPCYAPMAVLQLTILDEHTHSFSQWVYEGNGSHSRSCACGETEQEPCTLVTEPGSAPTCTSDGWTERVTCAVCLGVLTERETIPAYPCPSADFRDVPLSAWYHPAVDDMVHRGIMNGTGNGLFEPTKALNRAELVQVLYRMSGDSWEQTQTAFADVSPSAWYARAVAWASANGIVYGVSETWFGPQDPASREMVVTILCRFAGGAEPQEDALAAFADAQKVSAWARPAMNWAVSRGYLRGADGRLNPGSSITRAELAMLMMSYLLNP